MKISEIMTASVNTCEPGDELSYAASVMWQSDCGAVPVVNGEDHVVGIITDRDICIALASRNVRAGEVTVSEVMTTDVVTCRTDDAATLVLDLMAARRLHRLPVIDADGFLAGIVSINDLLSQAGKSGKHSARISRKDMLQALRAITAPRSAAAPAIETAEGSTSDPETPEADSLGS